MRWLNVAVAFPFMAALPANAHGWSEGPWSCGFYRQDVAAATGFNQILPVAEEDAATVRFYGVFEVEIITNGEAKSYYTIGGGTGIRSRAAINKDKSLDDTHTFQLFDISAHVRDGEPDHILVLDGDLYWPECP